jgi:hypothetical protein
MLMVKLMKFQALQVSASVDIFWNVFSISYEQFSNLSVGGVHQISSVVLPFCHSRKCAEHISSYALPVYLIDIILS